MEWISVKDKLPNELDLVLVTDGEDTSFALYENECFISPILDDFIFNTITHWMNFPEPPKEGNRFKTLINMIDKKIKD